jgi:Protein of unknown function (DUF4031)
MSVYVDNAKNDYGRMKMCHMVADTLDELHMMAGLIGVQRKWFQSTVTASFPHYDICQSKRALAVQYKAVEVDRRGLAEVMRRVRSQSAKGSQHG